MPGVELNSLTWKGWTVLAGIIIPIAAGSFFLGSLVFQMSEIKGDTANRLSAFEITINDKINQALKNQDEKYAQLTQSLSSQISLVMDGFVSKLSARDVKLNHVYDQLNANGHVTVEDFQALRHRVKVLEEKLAACQPKLDRVMHDVGRILEKFDSHIDRLEKDARYKTK